MGKYIQINHKIITWVLSLALCSLHAESTDDTLGHLPPPTKKTDWKASTFAGCALLAVVGGIFAICWSGGGPTHKHHHKHCDAPSHSRCGNDVCPNTITADCMAGSCIDHNPGHRQNCNHEHKDCQPHCEIVNNPPPCCALNGGVAPF